MLKPLRGQVLINLLPPDQKTSGGLFLPDIAQSAEAGSKAFPRKGRVEAVGVWKSIERDGQTFHILPDFKPGDVVILSDYAGTKLTRGIGETLRLCRVDDVLAILEEQPDTA